MEQAVQLSFEIRGENQLLRQLGGWKPDPKVPKQPWGGYYEVPAHLAVRFVTLTTDGVDFLKISIDTFSSGVMRAWAAADWGPNRVAVGAKQLLIVMAAAVVILHTMLGHCCSWGRLGWPAAAGVAASCLTAAVGGCLDLLARPVAALLLLARPTGLFSVLLLVWRLLVRILPCMERTVPCKGCLAADKPLV